jgi:HK97 family phage portal protein
VADGIDRISKEVAAIEPKLYDKVNKVYVDHDILYALKSPNSSMTQYQFIYNLSNTYQIFGNVFLAATGISKLQELAYVEPQYLNLLDSLQGTINSSAKTVSVNKEGYNEVFTLDESSNPAFYVSQNGTKFARLIRNYDTRFKGSSFGISKLVAVSYDIEQMIGLSKHNISRLKKGVKPSGMIVANFGLSQDQKDRLRDSVHRFYSGAQNAGDIMLLEEGMDFRSLDGQSNRTDSDFQVLRQNTEASIYRRLEIPAALVSNQAMTYNNLEVASLMLYDNAVIPLVKTLYKQLEDLLFFYGKIDNSRYTLTYDENEIAALAVRKSNIIKDKTASGAYTYNEIREMRGDPKLDSGGDDVYVQTTQVPVGENNVYDATGTDTSTQQRQSVEDQTGEET